MNELTKKKICTDDLIDIDRIRIDITMPLEKKAEKFVKEIKNPYLHKNGDYIVNVEFSDTDYTATDALKHYLSRIAESKY